MISMQQCTVIISTAENRWVDKDIKFCTARKDEVILLSGICTGLIFFLSYLFLHSVRAAVVVVIVGVVVVVVVFTVIISIVVIVILYLKYGRQHVVVRIERIIRERWSRSRQASRQKLGPRQRRSKPRRSWNRTSTSSSWPPTTPTELVPSARR